MYDVIIIGSWSAGFPAGMYASRYQLKNLIIGEMLWGALSTSHNVENYPGIISAPGWEIMSKFQEHAVVMWSELLQDRVEEMSKIVDDNTSQEIFVIKTISGKEFTTKKVILATGNTYKMLWIPGEKEYYWQGVSYCATCDGNFYKNLNVGMVWAGNTAITEALYLAEIAKTVHIFIRWDHIKAENIWVEKAKEKENIIFHFNTELREIQGSIMWVNSVLLSTGEHLAIDWVFVAIGTDPITELADSLGVKKDKEWYIIVDNRQKTSVDWLYAAGDVTTNSNKFRQTIMSAAEGCLAANSVHEDLLEE